MTKSFIRTSDDAFEFLIRETIADKGLHHPEGRFFIRKTRKRGDVISAHGRDGFGHIKPAIAREAGQHRFFEGQFGGVATGRDVFHGTQAFFGLRMRRR